MRTVGLALVFLLGAWEWAAFVDYGRFGFTWSDWNRVGYYFVSIRDALHQGVLPLYYASGIDGEWINFIWPRPDAPVTPELLLLRYLEPGPFLLVYILFLWTVAFSGVLAIARRYRLSFLPTALLAVILCFNGFAVGHIGIGHSWSLGYFFVPWFCYYVWILADGGAPILTTSIKLGFVLAAIFFEGSGHILAWGCIFLAVLALTGVDIFITVAAVACWVLLFAATRLIPYMVVFPIEAISHYAWFGGYQNFTQFAAAILSGQRGLNPLLTFAWEYDAYLGPAVAFLVVVGLVLPFAMPGRVRHVRLLLASAPFASAMFASISRMDMWVELHNSGWPVIGTERLTARFIIMPILVLTVQGCIALQRVLDRKGPLHRGWVTMAALLLVIITLAFHEYTRFCAPQNPLDVVVNVPRPHVPVQPSGTGWGTIPGIDPVAFHHTYVMSIAAGTAVSAAALFAACMVLWRERAPVRLVRRRIRREDAA